LPVVAMRSEGLFLSASKTCLKLGSWKERSRRKDLLSHPQQRAEIVAPIADIDDLFESLQPSVRSQPLVELIPLAHVDETSDLAGMLVR
jgi:hypothetical protein